MSSRGAKLPKLLLGAGELPCPWNSRAEFFRARQTTEMKQLRQFLADTVDLQAEFMVNRLETALPKMLDEAAPADRENVRRQFERVASTPQGCYALVDYVNFKGEGVLHTERYRGQGWGLLQVLEGMTQSDRGPGRRRRVLALGARRFDSSRAKRSCRTERGAVVIRLDSSRKQLHSTIIYGGKTFDISLRNGPVYHGGSRGRGASNSFAPCRATHAQSFRSHSQARAGQDQPIIAETSYARCRRTSWSRFPNSAPIS